MRREQKQINGLAVEQFKRAQQEYEQRKVAALDYDNLKIKEEGHAGIIFADGYQVMHDVSYLLTGNEMEQTFL